MKRNLLFVVLAITGLLLWMSSCQKAPELTLTSSSNIEFSADGSSGSITFTANRDWTARAYDSWVSVSPTSGTASDGPVTVTVRCNANTTYEDRSTTVTIKMGDLSQTVSVKQPANKGIVLPKQVFDLQSDTRSIDVEVQANVQYSVSTSANWIKQVGTKALSSKTLSFSIEENKTYDPREGKITIKPTEGNVQEQVITVRQAQKAAMNVEKTSYEMPYGGGEIEIKVEANVAFTVTPNVDWLHYIQTKALTNSTVCIKVDENTTYSNREGKIEIAQQNGSLKHTITVKQAGRIAVTSVELNKTSFQLKEGDTETLIATVKPDDATDKTVSWSSSDTGIATVDANGKVTAVKEGSATITARAGDITASCSVTIKNKPVLEAVDLGLSVKWASFNLGAEKPEDYGDYFAWGEKVSKTKYEWSNYEWCNGTYSSLTKYNYDAKYGTVDSKIELELADDAAYAILGDGWRMPTIDEIFELETQCTWTWTENNGVKGYAVKSKTNGNSIFLPAAGYKYKEQHYVERKEGHYWASSLRTNPPYLTNKPCDAQNIFFSSSIETVQDDAERCYGFSIRPVYGSEADIPVSSITLNKTELSLTVGGTETLIATIQPSNALDKTITWSSSNTAIASVDANGKVTAVKEGSATITAKAGGKTASCSVTIKNTPIMEAVDLGLSVKWASFNLGAEKPEDYGDYFAWGEIVTKSNYSWSTYKFSTNSSGPFSKYNTSNSFGPVDNKTVLEADDDVAHELLGGNWRMPTDAEWTELRTKCSWTWTTQNGVKGYKFIASNGNSIFLPAAGYWYDTDLRAVGSDGYYWSSSLTNLADASYSDPRYARGLYYYPNDVIGYNYLRCYGQSVRPVYGIVSVSSISLDKESINMSKGESIKLIATIKPDNASNIAVRWTSSSENVAMVNDSGEVTALAYGVATISVHAGDKTASCTVTVTNIPVESVSINKKRISLAVGNSESLVAVVKPDNASDKTVTWTSSDSNVATVSSTGIVRAVNAGIAAIGARAGEHVASCIVSVGGVIPPYEIWFTTVNDATLSGNPLKLFPDEFGPGYIEFDDGVYIMSFDSSIPYIPNNAFGGSNLTSIIIPNSVKYIGTEAFSDCVNLTQVIIPDSVTDIGNDAFYGCVSLSSVVIPGSVSSIGNGAFSASGLTSITIQNGVKSIGALAFSGTKVSSITIPGSVETIGDAAFLDCTSLKTTTIQSGVKKLGEEAFFRCSSLTSVSIPETVESIEAKAFSACTNLSTVSIAEGVSVIGNSVFDTCSSLESIKLPGSVRSIGQRAFISCKKLSSIVIPEGVTSIGEQAFNNCIGLKSITIPSSMGTIGAYAFYRCSAIEKAIVDAGTPPAIGTGTFDGKYPIYVPSNSVSTYKSKWSGVDGNRIHSKGEL
ncbi:MAG: leucine-rich repeat protein [Bacteroidales bacterium]|nr:leucine-rich repeat protein [Bacteroidales bacterium]